MRTFQRGEKAKLSDLTPATELVAGVTIAGAGSEVFDVSCFGVDASGKLSDDRYFIFFNQRTSPEGAITGLGPTNGDDEAFRVELSQLPASIAKLVFTATIDGAGAMSSVRTGHLRLTVAGKEVARFGFSGSDFSAEKAVILGEVYRKDVWRFAAVGQGFNGGLPALLTHFGGEALEASAPPPPPPAPAAPLPVSAPPPPPVAPPAPAPAVPPPPSVNLSKVTLEKKGASRSVDLRKGGGTQTMHFNLNWSAQVAGGRKRGFLSSGTQAPDLDLGCMLEMTDGQKTVIQPLGDYYGDAQNYPFVWLDKDDRSGHDADGENLFVYRPDLIRRMLVFALIYDGAPDFKSVGTSLTIRDQDGNETFVKLDNPDAGRSFAAICMITNTGSAVEIRKEEQYFKGAQECDQRYQFGFRWSAGSK